ncbi:copper resistance CopC family protein [Brevundimonas sp.]|uniref:copper resistance CopC family protein n=1 Tax=Brevundimonas sp. TaxID=1871086 RepID=UPI0035AFDAAF
MRHLLPIVAAGLFIAAPAVAQDAHAGHGAGAHAGHGQAAAGDHAAHGVVTSPADGAMTDGSPDWFTATFPHPMTLKAVTVTAQGRAAVTVPVAAAAATTRVSADLPTLTPGHYVLNWTAQGADGHEMTGAVRFMVH